MHYVSYNGLDWYVGSDGNHRSCLARFLFYEKGLTYLHGVSLRHYEFDDALLSVYAELQAERLCQQQAGLYWEIDLHSETLGREDTPGWKIDHFSPGFTLRLVGGPQGATRCRKACVGSRSGRQMKAGYCFNRSSPCVRCR